MRIFVVDDEQDITNSIRVGLKKKGFEVTAFLDPADALAHYKPGAYDMLLIDIRMPKMTGFELVREIRKLDKNVRFCFLTAFDIQPSEFKKVFPDVDVSCLLRKPIMISDLARILTEQMADSA